MLSAYIIIGGVSVFAVGSVLAEKQLLRKDEVGTAELIGGVMNFTTKYGKYAIVSYVLYQVITMFS